MKKNIILILSSLAAFIFSLQIDSFTTNFQVEGFAVAAQFLSIVGDGLTLTAVCVSLFVIGIISKRENMRNSGIYGLGVVLAAGFFTHLFKIAFTRPRPNFSGTDILLFLENPTLFDMGGRFNSFPSGHTTVSFALAYALSRSYPRLSPIFYAIAIGVGLSRISLGSHYPSDVMGGAILGTGVSMFLFSEARKHWKAGLFISLVVFVSFLKLNGFLLFDVDEAVFSEATREMVETGNYITPTYNYEPRYDKPILFYWLMAIAFKLFGINEFSARFTSAMFGAALVIMTFFFIKRLYGERAGILAGLCLLLNLEFFVYTHSAVTDMTLAFFITASLYSFYLGFYQTQSPQSRAPSLNKWHLLFWFFSALAVLTKGVIGILFPMGIAFIYILTAGKVKDIKPLLAPRFLLAFFAIAAPWYIAQLYIHGWEFFNAFVIKHHFQRYTEVISSHSGPIYFYIPIILGGFFPWVAFLPNAFYKGIKESREIRARGQETEGTYLFCTIWFLVVFIFFSLSRTKLPNYIMPLYPAMAVVTGLMINELIEKGFKRSWLYTACSLLIIISLSAAITCFFFPLRIPTEIVFTPYLFTGIGIYFSVIAVLSFILLRGRYNFLAIGGIAVATIAMLILLRVYGVPPVNIYLQKTLYQYSAYARENLGPDGVLATYEINQPSIAFYSKGKILKLDGESGLKKLVSKEGSQDILVITNKQNIEKLQTIAHLMLLYTDGKYALLAK